MTHHTDIALFETFRANLGSAQDIAKDLIGYDTVVPGPYGPHRMVYADYVASGRALQQIESFVIEHLLPLYANSHTEASYVGGAMTRARRAARDVIARACGAGPDHAVVFTGSGATTGINRLVHLLGVNQSAHKPLVLIGPYEHHSNILPWRDSGAEVIELPENTCGGPCLATLEKMLQHHKGRHIIGAFSAASNVTGTLTDVVAVTRMLKANGAVSVWDYAGGGPYLPIAMTPVQDAQIDAIVTSPHKFIGGPQASGVMIIRRDATKTTTPTLTGGGTVRFVSPTHHDYATSIQAREEAGTPNVIGDLRAAMCFIVKEVIGQDYIDSRNRETRDRAMQAWSKHPRIDILGDTDCPRLPIFSFRIRLGDSFAHQQLVTRLLSDLYGIQARGGCACAGPYVHRLLGINDDESEQMRTAILAGQEMEKPGFTRLNFSYLTSDTDVDFIIQSVCDLADRVADYQSAYHCDPATAIFTPCV